LKILSAFILIPVDFPVFRWI